MGARHRLLPAGVALALVLSGTAGTSAAQAGADAQTANPAAVSAGADAQAGGTTAATAAGSAGAEAQTVALDAASSGRAFDGVGALSAGASSRLLVDYPPAERERILDFLFRPGYGAQLQVLRVEIGGDTNSTAGSEPSHQRARGDLDCGRGYEWWLMKEAKRRNPTITLSGLQWGAPGWLRGGFWSDDNIEFLLGWLRCAERQGLHIDYLGGWNESADFDADWFVDLDKALRDNGFGDTGVIAADGWGSTLEERWKVADEMTDNRAFRDAVDVVSVHYPCGPQYNGAPFDHCPSTATAQALGKPLWSGEQGSQKYDIGAGPLAKSINRSYLDGRMTATVNWSLAASFYGSIPYAGVGLLRAYQPWSGYFEASRSLWSVAHTTQFARPGWRYLDSASGYLDGGGSYVTLRAPSGGDYSSVFETVDADAPQTVRLRTDGLSTAPVHLWATDLRSDDPADWFRHVGTVRPGAHLPLEPGHLYTVTTTTGQGKGDVTTRADERMRLPYRDNFERTATGRTPRLLSDFNGTFEAIRCPGRGGRCLGQTVTNRPVAWRYGTDTTPLTVAGDPTWSGDYRVAVDARVDEAPHVDLLGRVDGVQLGQGGQPGYRLRLSREGRWQLIEYAPDRTETILASGTVDRFAPSRWHRLAMSFRGNRISASVDGAEVAAVTDDRHDRGQVGVVVGDWARAQFDDLTVTPTAPQPRTIPQNEITATATSAQLGYEASNVLDANPTSLWHTPWSPPSSLPQSITLDLGQARDAGGLTYTPRTDGNPNGNVTAYTVSTSTDGHVFHEVARGSWQPTATTKTVPLPAGAVRYVRLEVRAGNSYGSAAELNVLTR